MIDSFELMAPRIRAADLAASMDIGKGEYAVLTLHRPSNVDHRPKLEQIVDCLLSISKELSLVFPVHPRTRQRLNDFGLMRALDESKAIHVVEPLSYIEFMSLVLDCRVAITDSGGIQEETSYLGIPCLTLRENTERPITISLGTNRLVEPENLEAEVSAALDSAGDRPVIDLWDGKTAQRVADSLKSHAGA